MNTSNYLVEGYKIVLETEVLAAFQKNGLKKFWKGYVVTDGTDLYTTSEAWRETKKGHSVPTIAVIRKVEVKNVGKSNETTPYEQAALDMESDFNKKKNRKGYDLPQNLLPPQEERYVRPMLAEQFHVKRSEGGKKVKIVNPRLKWPAVAQPKLDGVRQLYRNGEFWSRQSNPTIPEVVEHLQLRRLASHIIVDGELMLPHDKFSFQQTTRAVSEYKEDLSPHLEYHVYDIIDLNNLDMPYADRARVLHSIFSIHTFSVPGLKLVPGYPVHSEEEVLDIHESFLAVGYEGTMIRNMEGAYNIDNRSHDLLKYKDFTDEEFVIVGVTDSSGEPGALRLLARSRHHRGFHLPLPSHDELVQMSKDARKEYGVFSVRPKGTIQGRRNAYQAAMENPDEFIGKPYTVEFFALTDDGLPRFPKGKAFRDYE